GRRGRARHRRRVRAPRGSRARGHGGRRRAARPADPPAAGRPRAERSGPLARAGPPRSAGYTRRMPSSDAPPMLPVSTAGSVMLIGGAEDKIRDKVILSRFVERAGGADGHVVVISTASSLGELATERYRGLFT